MERPCMGFLCNLGRKLNADLSSRGPAPSPAALLSTFFQEQASQHTSRHTFAALCPTSPRSTYPRAFFPTSLVSHLSPGAQQEAGQGGFDRRNGLLGSCGLAACECSQP